MATYYLRSTTGSDANDGLTWATAKATLAGVLALLVAGDTVYISKSHHEVSATPLVLDFPGTPASPNLLLCVDDAGDPQPPTIASTGAIVSTGSGSSMVIRVGGSLYTHGVTIRSGVGSTSSGSSLSFLYTASVPHTQIYENCEFHVATTNGSAGIGVGASGSSAVGSQLVMINTPIRFSHVGQDFSAPGAIVIWKDTPDALPGAVPTDLLEGMSTNGYLVQIHGVDLSAMGAGSTLIRFGNRTRLYDFRNCKLGAGVAITAGSIVGHGGATVRIVNCDSADTNYRYYKQEYEGEIFNETTVVRTGGASDGTTPISRKMVSSAHAKTFAPLTSDPTILWNEDVGSVKTATVEIVTDGLTLTDAEAWIEVEHLGTAGFPLSDFVSDRVASILAAPANQPASAEAWTTTGLASPVKQKLSVQFTPQEKGPVAIRVHLARPSTTMFFCPKAEVA